MPNYRAILKKVGLALVAFGLVDIALMIYVVSHGQSYSSSFNIFAVVAGIFLLRGSLGATRLVTWFSAFMLTGFILAIFFLFPFLRKRPVTAPSTTSADLLRYAPVHSGVKTWVRRWISGRVIWVAGGVVA